MPEKKLPASRFARVPKVIRAIELVYLPKRLAIFMNKERQEAAGWSANTPKPVVAFKVKNPRQASETAARYLLQLSQQGYQVAVAKDIKQLTTVTKDPSAPASVDEPVEDGEDKGVDKRTSFVRKLILQAFREKGKEKSEGVMDHENSHTVVEGIGDLVQRNEAHVGLIVGTTSTHNPSMSKAPNWKIINVGKNFVEIKSANPSGAWTKGTGKYKYTWEDGAFRRGGKSNPSQLVHPDPDYYKEKPQDEAVTHDYHRHLHRLVEAREQEEAMKSDPLHQFRVLSGVRATLPSLEEALTGVTEHEKRLEEWADVTKMSDADLRKNYKEGKEREDALMGQPLKFYNAIKAEMKRREMKIEGVEVQEDDYDVYRDQKPFVIEVLPPGEKSFTGMSMPGTQGRMTAADRSLEGAKKMIATFQKMDKKHGDPLKYRIVKGGKTVYTTEDVDDDMEEWGHDPLPAHGLAKVMPGQSKKKGKPMTITTHHTGGKSTTRQVSEQKGYLTIRRMVIEGDTQSEDE